MGTILKQLKPALRCALLAAACIASAAQAAPAAELWERWQAHDPASTATVDHSAWDEFLKRYLSERDGINRLDYGAVADSDRSSLQSYLKQLAASDVDSLNRDEQRAYWINLYNALTVETILEHYPVDSIREISEGFLSSGPWGDELVSVAGEALTLDAIEHRILRPIWRDARLHYAVNCASIGCPNLAAEAFTPDNAEELLDAGARAYVNHPRAASVADGRLAVSSIYKWFIADFGGNDEGVIAHLREYADGPLLAALQGIDSIDSDDYDWSLNRP